MELKEGSGSNAPQKLAKGAQAESINSGDTNAAINTPKSTSVTAKEDLKKKVTSAQSESKFAKLITKSPLASQKSHKFGRKKRSLKRN